MRTKSISKISAIIVVAVLAVTVLFAGIIFAIGNNKHNDLVAEDGTNLGIGNLATATNNYGTVGERITDETADPSWIGIATAEELIAFLAGSDAYGYLKNDIPDYNTGTGSAVRFAEGRTFDGNGFKVEIINKVESWAGGNYQLADGNTGGYKFTYALGAFVSRNSGSIKNANFSFANINKLDYKSNSSLAAGIICGINEGTISNTALTVSGEYRAHRNAAGNNDDLNGTTQQVGGFAGLNWGKIHDVTVEITATGTIEAGSKAKAGLLGSSKAAALTGGIAGGQFKGGLIENVIVKGSGTISATTSKDGGITYSGRPLPGQVIGGNSDYAFQDLGEKVVGTVRNVFTVFTGVVTAKDSANGTINDRLGIIGCSDKTSNLFVGFETTKRPTMCGCTGNGPNHYSSNDIYSVVGSNEADIEFSFGADDTVNLVGVLKNAAQGDIIWDAAANYNKYVVAEGTNVPSTVKISDYKSKTNSFDVTIDMPAKGLENMVSIPETLEVSKCIVKLQISRGYIGKIAYSGQASLEKVYDGGLVQPYAIKKQDDTAIEIIPTSLKAEIMRNDFATDSIKYVGKYTAKLFADDNNFVYIDNTARVLVDFDDEMLYSATISNATINDISVADAWYKNHTFNVGIAGVADAIDGFEYSTDGGTIWTKVDALSLLVDKETGRTGRNYFFRAYSGAELVTDNTPLINLKIDNTNSTISNVITTNADGTVDLGIWTAKDITLTFEASDAVSEIASVMIGENVLSAVDGKYSFVFTETSEQTVVVTDLAGNVYSQSFQIKIDKTLPTLDINSNGYTAGDTATEAVTFSVATSFGISGGSVEYSLDAGTSWANLPINNGVGTLALTNNTPVSGNQVMFRAINNANVAQEEDFGTVIINRIANSVTITNENLVLPADFAKIYNGTDNFDGSITLQSVDSNVIDVETLAKLQVTAKYDSKNAGARILTITVSAIGDNVNTLEIIHSYTNTQNTNIAKANVTVSAPTINKLFGDDLPTLVFTITGLFGTDTLEIDYTTDAVKLSNKGEYVVAVDDSKEYENYIISESLNGVISVVAKPTAIILANYAGLTYNGKAQKITAFYQDINGTNIAVEVEYVGGFDPIAAAEYTANYSIADENYVSSNGNSITFTIAKATPIINAQDKVITYNGMQQEISAKLFLGEDELVGDYTLKYLYDGGATLPINVKGNNEKYTVEITYDGNENLVNISKVFYLTIEKAPYNISFPDKTVSYNRQAQSNTLDASVFPVDTVVTYTGNDRTSVGKYKVVLVLVNPNYINETLESVLEIQAAEITEVVFEGKTVVYDGTNKSIVATIPDYMLDADVRYLYNGNASMTFAKDAGRYSVRVIIEDKNYIKFEKTVTLTIEKGIISGVTFNNKEFNYTGSERVIEVEGLPKDGSVVYENNVLLDAGYYNATAKVSLGANYNDLLINAEIRIKPIEVEVLFRNVDGYKAGDDLMVEAYFIDVFGDEVSAELVFNKDEFVAEVGTYVIEASIYDTNYVVKGGTKPSVTFEVSKKVPVGAIVGGTVGGVVGVSAIGLGTFFFLKRKKLKIV